MPSIPLPSVPRQLLSTPEALAELCAHIAQMGRFAFDTEFIGESSYQPRLCLVQVATEQRVELIDPFALEDMGALWALFGDPKIEKVCHAGDQDMAIVWQRGHVRTANVFDVQIAGGMIGLGYPLAYWRLVEEYTGVELEKAHTFSAWDRRPLSRAQFLYGIDDVRYLPYLHGQLRDRLGALGHSEWLTAACEELAGAAATSVDPSRVYVRFKGANQLSPVQLAVLRELAILREQLAFEHDLPARVMLRDEVLMDLAARMPRQETDLGAIRSLPQAEARSYGDQIVAAVQRGRAVPPEQRPTLPSPPEDSMQVKRVAEMLWAAAQLICAGRHVSPALVTSQGEMLSLARRVVNGLDLEQHVLMTSWHRPCLGQALLDLVAGRIHLDIAFRDRQLLTQLFDANPG